MGNNMSCMITGTRTIRIKMCDGVVRTLCDVKHISYLKGNLISLSTLDVKGYKYTDKSEVLKVSNGALVMIKG